MKTLICASKGGVGKSTIAVNLAAISAAQGKKVLVIDCDPQGNASRYLLGEAAKTVKPTLYDFFESQLTPTYSFFSIAPASSPMSYVHETPFKNLFVLPSNNRLLELHEKLTYHMKNKKLATAVSELEKQFDEIIIDTANAYNFFSMSAMIAAEAAILPFDCDDFSRDALYATLGHLAEMRAEHNPALQVKGIVVNQFLASSTLPQELVDTLKAEGLPVLNSKLSQSVVIRKSHQQGKPMIYLDKHHKLTLEYLALHEELQGRTQ
ncbi:MAG: ParA family protein [Burkholderiaceae bacterium]